jgi:hypothetical protein
VAAEAGAFVEMDAKPLSKGLNLFERFLSRIKLFLGEETILQFETLRRLLWRYICAERHNTDRENHNQFEKFTECISPKTVIPGQDVSIQYLAYGCRSLLFGFLEGFFLRKCQSTW